MYTESQHIEGILSHFHTEPSSHTVIKILESDEKAVARTVAVHSECLKYVALAGSFPFIFQMNVVPRSLPTAM